jgi:DNA modification methylase
MTDRSRQSTLGSPTGDIESLDEIDWTFHSANTQYLTHGLHPYPARMIPQIPATIFDFFKRKQVIQPGDRAYDPFSGSGTTAVEARLHGLHAEANDINPLACMLTLAKAIPLGEAELTSVRRALFDGLEEQLAESCRTDGAEVDVPEIRDGWFPEPQLTHLCRIRETLDEFESEFGTDLIRFLRVGLSITARKASFQRNGEYKRYRIPEADRDDFDPDVYSIFSTVTKDNIDRMLAYSEQVDPDLTTTVHYADSRQAVDHGVETSSADIVITSPPYGDHSTTVAYGQFSQDPAIIAGDHTYDEMKRVDKVGLGGSEGGLEPLDELEEWSESLSSTLDVLRQNDGRAVDAMQFFRDYFEVMKQVARILKSGQPVAWVVANRTMSRVTIPTHLITRELCEHLGFEHEVSLPREIPTKTLPWENAPENVPGLKGDLMAEENIVVMRAP